MLVTVTNPSATLTLNSLAVAEDGIATGGSRERVLPYPFGHITLAPLASKQLPMQPADFRGPATQMQRGTDTRTQWNRLVQSGLATVAVAAQAGRRDEEELFLNLV